MSPALKYRLRFQERDLDLCEGQFLIGRSTDCQLSLDDPLVSRRHALLKVNGSQLEVRDLGSRNGLSVNGKRLNGSLELSDGDRLEVGGQTMVVMAARDDSTANEQAPPTQVANGFSLVSKLADKAFAMDKPVEAERILSAHLKGVMADSLAGKGPEPEVCVQAAEYASRLAVSTGRGVWIDYIFKLYAAHRRPCPATIVDELYSALRKVDRVEIGVLRDYLEVLRADAGGFGPAERFLLSRIEGLERLAVL